MGGIGRGKENFRFLEIFEIFGKILEVWVKLRNLGKIEKLGKLGFIFCCRLNDMKM
jgi:hypothetical protein